MEHSDIEKYDVIGRYLSGRLSDDELMRFEEHFLGCPHCADQIETTDEIRSGLRAAAVEDAWLSQTHIRAGWPVRAARLGRGHRAILIAAVVLLMAPAAWLAWMWNSARRDLMEARRRSSALQYRYEQDARAARDLAKEIQDREAAIAAERDRLAAQLEGEREMQARLANRSNRAAGTQAVVPIFTLSMVRDSNPDLSDPVDEITIPASSKSMVLSLEMDPDPDIQAYRAAVLTADGRKVWSRAGLKPESEDGLALSFNSGLLKPGTYLLTLEGFSAAGTRKLIARYTFRALSR